MVTVVKQYVTLTVSPGEVAPLFQSEEWVIKCLGK